MPRWLPRAMVLALALYAVFQLGSWAFHQLIGLLINVLIAFFLALAVEPAVSWMAARGVRRGLGTFLVFLGVLIAAAGFVTLLGSMLAGQIVKIVEDFPDYLDSVINWINTHFHTELRRVARVSEGIWEDVPARRARGPEFASEAGVDYVVVVRRDCRDWEGRERWSDERASWFLLREGRLEAYDHWRFGPRCSLRSALRPVAADSVARATERDLRRWLDQRHPPGRLPVELRFQRGVAYAEAGRLAEARAALHFGDGALVNREDLFEKREVTPAEAEAFEIEGRRLRALREDLRAAIQRAEAPPAPADEARANETPAD